MESRYSGIFALIILIVLSGCIEQEVDCGTLVQSSDRVLTEILDKPQYQCFFQNSKTCHKARFSVGEGSGDYLSKVNYRIQGASSVAGACEILIEVEKNPIEHWRGKQMTCDYSSSDIEKYFTSTYTTMDLVEKCNGSLQEEWLNTNIRST